MSQLRSDFVRYLYQRRNQLEAEVTGILTQHGSVSVDHIMEPALALSCVRHFGQLGLAVTGIGYWCNYTPDNAAKYGCPHGYGGYSNGQGGYFSECCQYPYFDVEGRGLDLAVAPADYEKLVGKCNGMVLGYLNTQLSSEPFFSPCLCVSLLFPG